LPPPPATLGAASVGLVLEGEDEVVLAEPPAVKLLVEVVTEGERGLIVGIWGAGVPIADTGGADVAGAVGAPLDSDCEGGRLLDMDG
jgi:hypothetical protein